MTLPGHIDLNGLTVFNAVVNAGGFTAAARSLGVAPAKVSVEIARLEAQLGAALFTRTTRRVALTEAGRALQAQCLPLLEQLMGAMDGIHDAGAALNGLLRITAPVGHAAEFLAPALARFAALHPALQLDLHTSDRITNVVSEGIDVAIRMGWLRDSSLRAVRLGGFEQYVVAAPGYLRGITRPTAPEDLAALDFIALALLPTPLTWEFTGPGGEVRSVHVKSRIRVDSPQAMRALILNDAGISVLDQHSAQRDLASGRLVRLLPDWAIASGGIHAVLPPGRHTSKKVRAFIRFYQEYLARVAAHPARSAA